VLNKFPILENLTITILDATSNYYSRQRKFSNPLNDLGTWPCAPSLRTLTFSDQKLNILDISTIFTLPNLKHLSLSRFETTAAEGISPAMLALAPQPVSSKALRYGGLLIRGVGERSTYFAGIYI
jgi:hypothetical protein